MFNAKLHQGKPPGSQNAQRKSVLNFFTNCGKPTDAVTGEPVIRIRQLDARQPVTSSNTFFVFWKGSRLQLTKIVICTSLRPASLYSEQMTNPASLWSWIPITNRCTPKNHSPSCVTLMSPLDGSTGGAKMGIRFPRLNTNTASVQFRQQTVDLIVAPLKENQIPNPTQPTVKMQLSRLKVIFLFFYSSLSFSGVECALWHLSLCLFQSAHRLV